MSHRALGAEFAHVAPLLFGFLLSACEGPQSALDPAGRDAERIADLFWWMSGGALVVWAVVIGVAVYAIVFPSKRHGRRTTRLLIIGGGAIVPSIVLCVLLIFGLRMLPPLLEPGAADGPQIRVSGEQWWWRVTYEMPDGTRFDLANELRLPVGKRVSLSLVTPDVIHSFWVPAIGGKVDMIPGRTNRMALEPTRTGVFRGSCAEYCGTAHAKMAFHVVVVSPEEFAKWAKDQAAPAVPLESAEAKRGREQFSSLGCGACHRVRGTEADGVVGPDLTHVGGRHSLGAGILDNDVKGFETWLSRTQRVKPGVHMPSFHMLPERDLSALATYLDGLR